MKNRFLLIFVCIFLSLVVVISGVLGIILAVKERDTLVKYGNVSMREGECVYLATVFKSDYIAYLNASGVKGVRDSDSFWSSVSDKTGKTYGEMLNDAYLQYISSVAVQASLFLDASSFGKEEKNYVNEKVDKRLSYLGYTSKREFNELSDQLGFDYDDMVAGSRLLCMASLAYEAIYGDDGSAIASYPEDGAKYLDTYTHVALIFLRTEDVYVYDENGELQYNDDGTILKRPLSDAEKSERAQNAEKLRSYIENLKNEAAGAITPETFELYLKEKSDTDPDMISRGYYFNKNAEITAQFATAYPEVVEAAFDMKIGEYREALCSDSVCFIYRYAVTDGAYADTSNVFFSDFYSDAAEFCFNSSIETLASEVGIKDQIMTLDVSRLYSNSEYVVNSWR